MVSQGQIRLTLDFFSLWLWFYYLKIYFTFWTTSVPFMVPLYILIDAAFNVKLPMFT